MARITVEKNIAFDDEKKLFYVTMNYGKDSTGKRIKTTKTFEKKKDAQTALKSFEADKIKQNLVFPSVLTVENWLTYWINDIKLFMDIEILLIIILYLNLVIINFKN